MMRGIFRCDNSFMAIWSASVSPSSGTRTGAFILWLVRNLLVWHRRRTCLICKARVPRIRALSYLVKYRVVTRTLFGWRSPGCCAGTGAGWLSVISWSPRPSTLLV